MKMASSATRTLKRTGRGAKAKRNRAARESPQPPLQHREDHAIKNVLTVSIDEMQTAAYWQALVPFLTVDGSSSLLSCSGTIARESKSSTQEEKCWPGASSYRAELQTHGYAVIPPESFLNKNENKKQCLTSLLSRAALILHVHGWPATFLAVYDEAWELAQHCQSWMDEVTSKRNSFCFDIVGFHVVDGVGFSPHRDRQPEDWQPKGHESEDPRTTFVAVNGEEERNLARYLTCWVALTDATPESSCLHYVSATVGYYAGDDAEMNGSCPLQKCFEKEKSAYQHIYCAAVKAGGFCCHTHRVIHWGNQGKAGVSSTAPARIALSFAFTNNEGTTFEPPNLLASSADEKVTDCTNPTERKSSLKRVAVPALNVRVALCSAQVINYSMLSVGDPRGWKTLAGEMLEKKHLRKFYKLFQLFETRFHPHYRKEIATKFVAVSLGGSGACYPAADGAMKRACDGNDDTRTVAPTTRSTAAPATRKQSVKEKKMKRTTAIKAKKKAEGMGKARKKERQSGAAADLAANSDSEMEDAALEAMLEAESGTKEVLFHDDFDMLAAGVKE